MEALFERFQITGDQRDLDESIRIIRTAVASGTHSDGEWIQLATSLCTVLRARFDVRGDLADLDEAIDLAEHTLRTNSDGFSTAALEFNLGAALGTRDRLSGTAQDRNRGLAALEMLAANDAYDLTLRIRAAHAGGVLLAEADPSRAAHLLAFAVRLLDNLVPAISKTPGGCPYVRCQVVG